MIALEEQGYEVHEVDVPQLAEAAALALQLQLGELDSTGYTEFMEQFAGAGGLQADRLNLQLTKEFCGPHDLASAYAAMQRRSLLRREMAEMVDYPILLTATSGEPHFAIGDDIQSLELVGQQWVALGVPTLAPPAVGMATTVRSSLAPLVVQVIGREFADHQVLDVAQSLSVARPVPTPIERRVIES